MTVSKVPMPVIRAVWAFYFNVTVGMCICSRAYFLYVGVDEMWGMKYADYPHI